MWTESGLHSFRFAELDWQAQGCAQCPFVIRDFVSLKKQELLERGEIAQSQCPLYRYKSMRSNSQHPQEKSDAAEPHPVAEGVHTDGQIPGAHWLASLVDGVSCFVLKNKGDSSKKTSNLNLWLPHTGTHKS